MPREPLDDADPGSPPQKVGSEAEETDPRAKRDESLENKGVQADRGTP